MTFIVEDGSGIVNANAMVTVAFADEYFTSRGITEWTGLDALKEVAIVKATDYVEKRFRTRFMGQPEFITAQEAKSVITFTVQPLVGETITIDGNVFTFVAASASSFQITIGTRLGDTIDNAILIINESGIDYGADTNWGQTMLVTAGFSGEDGNSIAVSTIVTGATWSFATLNGGNDEARGQALSFPRAYLYTSAGVGVVGVPHDAKQAVCEYALRALTAVLMPDPTPDATGGVVTYKKEKVGPIEEETKYLAGANNLLQSYPAADRLLLQYTVSGGGTIR